MVNMSAALGPEPEKPKPWMATSDSTPGRARAKSSYSRMTALVRSAVASAGSCTLEIQ